LGKYAEVTLKELFSLCGNLCAFHSQSECEVNVFQGGSIIGEIAHIEGEKLGSARYNPSTTLNEKNSTSNLIILCPTHHSMIDKQVQKYTVDDLLELKRIHEQNHLNSKSKLDDLMIGAFVSFNSDTYSLDRIDSFLAVAKTIKNQKTKDLAYSHVRELLIGIQDKELIQVEVLKTIFDKLDNCFQDAQYLDLIEIILDKLPSSIRIELSKKYIEPILNKLYQNDLSNRSFVNFYNYLNKPSKEKLEFLITNIEKLPQRSFNDILLPIDLGNLTDKEFTEIEKIIWKELDSLNEENNLENGNSDLKSIQFNNLEELRRKFLLFNS